MYCMFKITAKYSHSVLFDVTCVCYATHCFKKHKRPIILSSSIAQHKERHNLVRSNVDVHFIKFRGYISESVSSRKKSKSYFKKMAGGDAGAESSKLTGLSKIFNGTTTRGRAHVAMATYASVGLIIAYFALKPKSKK